MNKEENMEDTANLGTKENTRASTKVYLAFNTFDGYLNIIFNNLVECVNTINGDLKTEIFDGQPMFRAYKSRL